jgi:hypothetical protein
MAVAMVGVLLSVASDCPDKRPTTSSPASSATSVETAAFTLDITNDGFGLFMPVNNQFKDEPRPAKFHSGFFVQLANFTDAAHTADKLVLSMSDDTTTDVDLIPVTWVDIVCTPSGDPVLDRAHAQAFFPDPDVPGSVDRVLHDYMNPKSVRLITLFRGDDPLVVHSTRFDAEDDRDDPQGPIHSHDKFVFESGKACSVRIWEDAVSPAKSYPLGAVRAMRVVETDAASPHGGIHQPPWTFGL